jgi:hypothetical protein
LPGAPDLEHFSPAWSGTIWIDNETSQILRIEEAARDLPGYFLLDMIDTVTDYDFVKIGDRTFLLPTHSETRSCQRTSALCFSNQTDFKDYDKFTSNATITFDGAQR